MVSKSFWDQGPSDWLTSKLDLTVEQLRQREHDAFRAARPDKVGSEHDRAGGFWGDKFDAFTAKFLAGDELWEFRSPDASWRAMAGRAGYAIVRSGEVVATFVTTMN